MVRVDNPQDYTLQDIVVATDGKHKYVAILKHKTGRTKQVPFGDVSYSQYRDSLGVYSNLDHLDKKRQSSFFARHAKNIGYKFSSAWFSKIFLWS